MMSLEGDYTNIKVNGKVMKADGKGTYNCKGYKAVGGPVQDVIAKAHRHDAPSLVRSSPHFARTQIL